MSTTRYLPALVLLLFTFPLGGQGIAPVSVPRDATPLMRWAAAHPQAEPQALSLLQAVAERLAQTTSFRAITVHERRLGVGDNRIYGRDSIQMAMLRPGSYVVGATLWERMGNSTDDLATYSRSSVEWYQTDDTLWWRSRGTDGSEQTTRTRPLLSFTMSGVPDEFMFAEPFQGFLVPNVSVESQTWIGGTYGDRLDDPGFLSLRYTGKEQWQGTSYETVEWTYKQEGIQLPEDAMTRVTRFYIDPKTMVIRRVLKTKCGPRHKSTENPLGVYETDDLVVVQLTSVNQLRLADMVPQRPQWLATAKEAVLPVDTITDPVVGTTPFDFSLKDPDGKVVTLRDVLKGKRATLVYSLSYSCKACRLPFPYVQQIAEAGKADSVESLLLLYEDSDDARRPGGLVGLAQRLRASNPMGRILLVPEADAKRFKNQFGYTQILVLDEAGRVRYKRYWNWNGENSRGAIRAVLCQQGAKGYCST